MFVVGSWRFWVRRRVKTAWDREEVSFMFVAATVLACREKAQGQHENESAD